MGEKLDLKDFDILGIITLNDVQGIEKYVTPVKENGQIKTYLSRSKEYYNVKSMTELALEREELKGKLTKKRDKRNFVILENMLNCSGKVYFKKFQQYITSGKSKESEEELKRAYDCLMEDVNNIIIILQNEGEIYCNPRNILPVGDENSERRAIEMDNKAMLYLFAKSLKLKKNPEDVEVLTPGYGSIYIGPFFKAMYGYNFTNLLKSKYIDENVSSSGNSISCLMSSDRLFEGGKTVLALDDNIGTGATMLELKKELKANNVPDIISGAVQYNWRNYYRVSIGDKRGIDRFEIDDFDILSPLNYAGHKLYKHAISQLVSSGKEYIEYLKSKSYRKEGCTDLEGAIIRGVSCAYATGLSLGHDIDSLIVPKSSGREDILDKYKTSPSEVTNPISQRVIENIISNVNELNTQSHDVRNDGFDVTD